MRTQPKSCSSGAAPPALVTLNRPQALNAVTHAMVRACARSSTPGPTIRPSRALSSRPPATAPFRPAAISAHLYDLGQAGATTRRCNSGATNIRSMPRSRTIRKPYVALIDGIVMGGGVGVSVHGSHRVAGDRFPFAMPEVGIGFFPDVGATWFLPRMPGELGTYCALTGERFGDADGCAAGIATHRIPSARFPALLEGLTGTVSVDAVLAAFAEPAGEGPIMARRAAIDRLFAGDSVEDILAALDREAASGGADAEWAGKTAATMRTKSPLSLKLALAQVRRGTELGTSRRACAPNSA